MIKVENKNTHAHLKFGKGITNLFLFINSSIHKTVVFYRTKSLIISKFYLLNKIISCSVFKHAIVNGIIKMKGFVAVFIVVDICFACNRSYQSCTGYDRL